MPINIDLGETQKFLEWLKNKLYLNSIAVNARARSVRRGEVYRCNFGIGVGSEQQKDRPCVILQYDAGNANSPNTIVAPITHSNSHLPVVVPITPKLDASGNVLLDGHVLLGNIVCVSKARLGVLVSMLSPQEMDNVDKAVAISLDIKRHYDKLKAIHEDKLTYIVKLKEKIDKLEQTASDREAKLDSISALQSELGLNEWSDFEKFIRQSAKKI